MKNGRFYSFLKVKNVDDNRRVITGIATTPTPDRVGDIIVPQGVKFKNPMPFLWQHRHSEPIGTVSFGKATDDGIPFEATLADIRTPQTLADRLDEAWELIKAGLVRGASIGFRPIKYAFMDEGGIEFQETEVYELSAVTVPANAECTIETIKSLDSEDLKKAATGHGVPVTKAVNPAGAAAQPVKLTKKEGNTMNLAEKLKKLKAEKAAKAEEMKALAVKADEAGTTMAAADIETYEGLEKEIDVLDGEIKRTEKLLKMEAETAAPLNGGKGIDGSASGSAARSAASVKLSTVDNTKGLGLARVVKCIGLAKGNLMQAEEIAKASYQNNPLIAHVLKAAVAAGTTSDATWGGGLVGDETNVYADFVEYLRPQTILGRFGTGSIPRLRAVPFNTPLITQTTGGQGYWTGEGKGKGVTKFDFTRTTLVETKVANIAVITEELLRRSGPAADALIRDELVNALKGRLDIDFIDPDKAEVSGTSPASITNGVTAIHSSGTDADAVRNDVKRLLNTYIRANNPPNTGVLIMSSMTALGISMLTTALGEPEFSGLGIAGGILLGIPVITSEYVPTDSSGSLMIMVNASDIYLGDEGGFQVDMSREASLEMDSAPTQNAGTPTAAQLVSLWQTNSVGFRAERIINWKKRRASAVAYVDQVFYGDAS